MQPPCLNTSTGLQSRQSCKTQCIYPGQGQPDLAAKVCRVRGHIFRGRMQAAAHAIASISTPNPDARLTLLAAMLPKVAAPLASIT